MSNKVFAINTSNAVEHLIRNFYPLVQSKTHPLVDRKWLAGQLTKSVTDYVRACEAWRSNYDPSRARSYISLQGVSTILRKLNQFMQESSRYGRLPFTRIQYDSAHQAIVKVREWIVDAVGEHITTEDWNVCYPKAHTTTVTVELLGDYRILDWEYRRKEGRLEHDGELLEGHIAHLVQPKGFQCSKSVSSLEMSSDLSEFTNDAGDVVDVSGFHTSEPMGGALYCGRSVEVKEYTKRHNSDVLLTKVQPEQHNVTTTQLFDDLHSSKFVGWTRNPNEDSARPVTVSFANYPQLTRAINNPDIRRQLVRLGWDGDVTKLTPAMAAKVLYNMHPDLFKYLRPITRVAGKNDVQDDLPTNKTADVFSPRTDIFQFTTKQQ